MLNGKPSESTITVNIDPFDSNLPSGTPNVHNEIHLLTSLIEILFHLCSSYL